LIPPNHPTQWMEVCASATVCGCCVSQVWLRTVKRGRLLKELLESLPVLDRVLRYVEQELPPPPRPSLRAPSSSVAAAAAADGRGAEGNDGGQRADGRLTILDLCSGFGYLSMFLAELLPPARVGSIVLLDKAWPMHSQVSITVSQFCVSHQCKSINSSYSHQGGAATAGQINPAHLRLKGWPISLRTCKNNLKTPSGRRAIVRTVFGPAPGPVAILGVHLCGQLAVQAVELFNQQPVSWPFPSWNRSILAETYLCHACSCQEILIKDGNGRAGHLPAGSQAVLPATAVGRHAACSLGLLQRPCHRRATRGGQGPLRPERVAWSSTLDNGHEV
jgi:hypothetical protein